MFYRCLFLVINDTDTELQHVFTRLRLHHCLSLAEPAPPELNFEMTGPSENDKKGPSKNDKKGLSANDKKDWVKITKKLSENSDFTTAWPWGNQVHIFIIIISTTIKMLNIFVIFDTISVYNNTLIIDINQ